jgi:hypothetical protein
MTVFTLIKANELSVKSVLSLESDRDDGLGLTLTTPIQDKFSRGAVAVVPGGFDEKASGVSVTGLGNRSPAFYVA